MSSYWCREALQSGARTYLKSQRPELESSSSLGRYRSPTLNEVALFLFVPLLLCGHQKVMQLTKLFSLAGR